MAEVEFRTDDGAPELVQPYINGQSLAHLVARLPARGRAHAERPSEFSGLSRARLAAGSRHLLGEPEPTCFGDPGDTVLLACSCGSEGGGALSARVAVGETTVTWSDFRMVGGRYLDDLGPFVFDRARYEAALADAG